MSHSSFFVGLDVGGTTIKGGVVDDNGVPLSSVSLATGSSSWGDSESGGPFDAVQMGFDGTRIFAKLIFNF